MKTIIIDGIEYNLTPKVLFKKGDFVVIQETTYQITEVENLNVTLSLNGRECLFDIDVLKNARLWDITKDAKDGDVLASELCDSIILFKGINDDNNIDFYCDYDFSEIDLPGDRFSVNNGQHYGNVEDSKDFHPATKEQRDALEKAMADAGYIFDFEKKELKKIEQEPAWSKEDEYRTEKLLGWINTLINYIHEDAMVSIDLRMERIQQVEQIKTWLKSISPQNRWKPSDEQMKQLGWIAEQNKDNMIGKELISLYQDLKKLREE